MSIYSAYPSLIRPFIFCLEPETAHNLVIKSGSLFSKKPFVCFMGQKVRENPITVMGLTFKNQVGLAAGMDKNGDAIDYFGALGFGHLELGTVTPLPQDGNPQPRMFRVKEARGLINRMGFNNKGVDYLVRNLQNRHYQGIVGVSIGKNETTPIDKALDDYLVCMQKVYNYCDYIAVNISCPNTKGLTALQEEEPLMQLLSGLKEEQAKLQTKHNKYVPLVVKISPDLTTSQLDAVCKCALALNIDGMTCSNTTTSRSEIHGLSHASEWGGLSGEPILAKATRLLADVHERVGDKIPLIGVGGVSSVLSAREKIEAGASLVQMYSALIYQGPYVIKEIADNL